MKQKVVFVVGPTASGKTDAAIFLARQCGGEVVSADSMAIYRGMDIGTAKPTLAERQGVPHHMIDCVDPKRPYSVSEYKQDACACIQDILSRGKQPIVCGGTGLYVNALIYPLNFTGAACDPAIRKKWEDFAARNGNEALHAQLGAVDPVSAQQIHPNNVRRVVRALEIYECTGRPKSAQATLDQPLDAPYTPVLAGISPPRQALYRRCDARVERMMARGLPGEVRALMEGGLSPDAQSMQGIGYKEIASALLGKASMEEAEERMKINTRHLAKRQLTWFNANDKIRWFDPTSYAKESLFFQELADHCLGNSGYTCYNA